MALDFDIKGNISFLSDKIEGEDYVLGVAGNKIYNNVRIVMKSNVLTVYTADRTYSFLVNGEGSSTGASVTNGITMYHTDSISLVLSSKKINPLDTVYYQGPWTPIVGQPNAHLSTWIYDTMEGSSTNVITNFSCFLPGTLIKTPDGEKKIEDIRIGDDILCMGEEGYIYRKVKAIHKGFKSATECKEYDLAGWPIRFKKNSMGENTPSEDLLVTSEHCIAYDGFLIPARCLVNKKSIFYDTSISSYTHFHIEMEAHEVIWANNTMVESYVGGFTKNKIIAEKTHLKSRKYLMYTNQLRSNYHEKP